MVALNRSLLRVGLASCFSVSITSLTVYQVYASQLGRSQLHRLTAMANQRIGRVDTWLTTQRSLLRQQLANTSILVAGRQLLSAPRRSRLAPPSASALALDQAFRPSSSLRVSTSLLSNGGIVFYSTQSNLLGRYRPLTNTTTLLQQHELESKPYNLYTDGETGLPAITLALPLYAVGTDERGVPDRSDTRLGVLAAGLDLGVLVRRVREDSPQSTVSIMLVGQTGLGTITEVYAEVPKGLPSSAPHSARSLPPLSSSAILRAMDGFSGSGAYLDANGVPVLGVYRWIPSLRMALLVESPQSVAFAPARRIARNIFIFGNAFVLFLCFLFSRRKSA